MSEAKMNWRAWDRESGGQRLCYEYEKMPEEKSGLVGGLWCWGVPSGSGYRRVTEHDLPAGSEVPDLPVWIGGGDDPRGWWRVEYQDGAMRLFHAPQRVINGRLESLESDGRWADCGRAKFAILVPWPDEPEAKPDPRDARIAELEAENARLRDAATKPEPSRLEIAARLMAAEMIVQGRNANHGGSRLEEIATKDCPWFLRAADALIAAARGEGER